MDNSVLLGLIILLLIGIVYAGTHKTGSKRLLTVLVVLLLILTVCFFHLRSEGFMEFQGYAGLDYTMGRGSSSDGVRYADLNQNISPLNNYDGLVLKSRIPTAPLLNSPVIFSPVGDGIQLGPALSSENYPSVDGTPNGEKSMFMLKKNMSSWDCCPSTYGDDSGNGCVCMSPEQINMFQTRGNNKSVEIYPGI